MHTGAHRLSLLAQVVALLRDRGIPFAVVGAAALAAHGVSRSTRDIDLLVVDAACLSDATWSSLQARGITAAVRRGSADDPLAGVVRLSAAGESPVDLIVGREPWQAGALERAVPGTIDGVATPVVGRLDLVLLKLHAAAPRTPGTSPAPRGDGPLGADRRGRGRTAGPAGRRTAPLGSRGRVAVE